MNGTLFGVSVGPGDPELLTLKAVKCLKNCAVIALPKSGGKRQVAYEIALLAVPEIQYKKILELPMPMTKDAEVLKKAHEEAALMVMEALQKEDVAFLTLGDSSIYATYTYLQKEVLKRGGRCEVIPGVPSFCAAAAALSEALVKGSELLHIIPASYALDLEVLALPGTKVLMKAGSQFGALKEALNKQTKVFHISMAENCGMAEGERLYHSLQEMPEASGYFSTVILRDAD